MDIYSQKTGLDKKFFLLCEPVVQEAGYRLYDLEYLPGQKLLRIYIQNPMTGSALIDDCVKVDHALSGPFETETWIPEEIILEVSSPGVYRHLNCLEHFKLSIGETISLVLTASLPEEDLVDAPKGIKGEKKLRGKLLQVESDHIIVLVKNFNAKISYKIIKKANLDPDLASIRE
jgi:ribosome maturation factor RimP